MRQDLCTGGRYGLKPPARKKGPTPPHAPHIAFCLWDALTEVPGVSGRGWGGRPPGPVGSMVAELSCHPIRKRCHFLYRWPAGAQGLVEVDRLYVPGQELKSGTHQVWVLVHLPFHHLVDVCIQRNVFRTSSFRLSVYLFKIICMCADMCHLYTKNELPHCAAFILGHPRFLCYWGHCRCLY